MIKSEKFLLKSLSSQILNFCPQVVMKLLRSQSSIIVWCKFDKFKIHLREITGIIAFSVLLLTLVLLVIAGTIYDLIENKNPPSKNRLSFLKAFSFQQNWNFLTKTSDQKPIDCINGLRVLSAFWIISGHRKKFYRSDMSDYDGFNDVERKLGTILDLHQFAVDTFMVISAYLLTISCLKSIEKWENFIYWWKKKFDLNKFS